MFEGSNKITPVGGGTGGVREVRVLDWFLAQVGGDHGSAARVGLRYPGGVTESDLVPVSRNELDSLITALETVREEVA